MAEDGKAHFTNEELASIYDYIHGTINQAQLARELGRGRTNTYYYIGRAVSYWLEIGVLKFNNVQQPEDLGGSNL